MQTEIAAAHPFTAKDRANLVQQIQDATGDWSSWCRRLSERKKPVSLRKRLSANCLFWGFPAETTIHQATTSRLVGLRKRAAKHEKGFDWSQAVDDWRVATQTGCGPREAIEAIAWSHALPLLLTRIPRDTWIELLAMLILRARHAKAASTDPLVHFMLGAELPLALAYALPELKLCGSLREPARELFNQSMDELLDGEGMPHARQLTTIQLLLASATRTLLLDSEVKKGRIDKAARLQFDWLVRQTLRWTRPDASTIFSAATNSPFFDELFTQALELTHDESDANAHQLLRGKRKVVGDVELPASSEHSEWSELATLRTSWTEKAARLAVDFSQPDLRLEVGVGRHTLLSGTSAPQIWLDGQRASLNSGWEEVCWETDDDLDYLELECSLADGWRVQRQFLLAREDRFAFIADAVLGPQSVAMKYRHALPLTADMTLEQADETNEATFLNSTKRATLIPLSLPEWQAESRTERLRADPPRLDVERTGRALYAALVLDLHPGRLRKNLTWRRLTVAENLQVLPPDSAVAYRLQIGKQQWIFYRSLDLPANRTFLGLNVISEFLAARFDTDGEMETLIDVAG